MQSVEPTSNAYIKKRLDDLVPGDVLLTPLYRTDGLLLIDKFKKLNEALIAIIRKHVAHISYVMVAAPDQNVSEATASVPKVSVSDNPIINALQSTPYWNNFDDNYESEALKRRALNIKQEFIKLLRNNELFISYFNKIKAFDDSLLVYSLNTVCIALKIGLTLELIDEDLLDLATASLFTNIGYTELPRSDFKSIFRAQQYNSPAMKKHLEIFTNITSASPYLRKKNIIMGILDHHEYYSGEGYPNKKRGEDISLFGRIIHIANDYDQLVGSYNRVPGLEPYEAFQVIFENREMKFDPNILNIFLHRTTYFKLGEVIHFGDGGSGKIIGFENYTLYPYRPIIKTEDGYVLNLLTSMLV